MANLKFQRADGGRADAGYGGSTGDCVTRALCINLGLDYAETYRSLTHQQNAFLKTTNISRRKVSRRQVAASAEMQGLAQGVNVEVYGKILKAHGWDHIRLTGRITPRQAMARYGRTLVIRAHSGSIRHLMAVKDGVLLDTWDSRNNRSVIDIWTPPVAKVEPVQMQAVRDEIAVHGIGPRTGEKLPYRFTDEIRMRIVAQRKAGASISTLAKGWGRSAASIEKILARLG